MLQLQFEFSTTNKIFYKLSKQPPQWIIDSIGYNKFGNLKQKRIMHE